MKVGVFSIQRRVSPDDEAERRQLQALYVAAREDNLSVLRELFSQGYDFQLLDAQMRTLLHLAHRAETVAFLIECGCNPLAVDAEQSTTLMHPGLEAKSNQLLLAAGVNVHACDIQGHTALYRQCDFSGIGWDNPDLDALQVLLDAGLVDRNEIEAILDSARACVTSAGENNDVAFFEHFLRKYQRPL